MSKIALTPNASGTGTFTIAAPGTNTDRTITLPDSTSTLATTADVAAVQGATLLGTLATTSGTSVTLSGLDLTEYKMLFVLFNDISSVSTAMTLSGVQCTAGAASPNSIVYNMVLYLTSGSWFSSGRSLPAGITGGTSSTYAGRSSVTTASTSITFGSTGTLSSGSILVYGVK